MVKVIARVESTSAWDKTRTRRQRFMLTILHFYSYLHRLAQTTEVHFSIHEPMAQ